MDERIRQIDALFAEWERMDSPGCALGIVENGCLVYGRGYGSANLEHGAPITTQTVFDIASTSKQFTATCIALLIERGQLRLDDKLSDFLPEGALPGNCMTIAHLLHHTSGWRDYLTLFELAGYRDEDYFTNEEVMTMLARQSGLNFTPGDMYLYSNTNYYLLGLIVERITGQTLAAFAEEQIFRPLGMTNTYFQDDHRRIVPGRATGYSPREGGGYRINMTTLDMVGDGALLTCVDDLALWVANFDDNRLGHGGRALIDLLHTRGRLNNGTEIFYAFGLDVGRYRGLERVGHSGHFVGYRAEMARFPAQQTAIICLANLDSVHVEELVCRAADLWFPDLLEPLPSLVTADYQPTDEELQSHTGLYWHPASNGFLDITLAHGALTADFGEGLVSLAALEADRYRSVDFNPPFEYIFAPDQVQVIIGGRPFLESKRIEPSARPLEQYTGEYRCAELDVIYSLVVQDGQLFARYGRVGAKLLRPAVNDIFRLDNNTLHFEKDEADRTTGFILNASRARGLRFERESEI